MSDEAPNDISRRTLLKRVGVGAAVVWTTPVITSIMTPAFAASLPSGGCSASGSYDYDFGHVDFSVVCDGVGNCAGSLDYTNNAGTAFHQTAVCGGCLCGQPNGNIVWFGGPISGATGGYAGYDGGWSIQRNTDGGPGFANDFTAGTQYKPGDPTNVCDPGSAGLDYPARAGDISVTCA